MNVNYLLLLLLQPYLTYCVPTASPRSSTAKRDIEIPSGFNSTIFLDDFSNPSGHFPDLTKWALDLGTSYPGGPSQWGTGEIQTYTSSPDNIAVTPSNTLLITPVYSNGYWTSARIETRAAHDFVCGTGQKIRMEARLKFGNAPPEHQLGIWPAFWSLGAAFRGNYWNWPSIGELDIVESLNGDYSAWHVAHCGPGGGGGPCREPNGLSAISPLPRGVWVTVALEVDRSLGGDDWRWEKLVWYVDGKATFTLTGRIVENAEAWRALARTPKFLLLDVAVGGGFPDSVAKQKTPTKDTTWGPDASLEVDYVAVFGG